MTATRTGTAVETATYTVTEGPDSMFYPAMTIAGAVFADGTPVEGGEIQAVVTGQGGPPCGVASVGADGAFEMRVGQSDPAGAGPYAHCVVGAVLRFTYWPRRGAATVDIEETLPLRDTPDAPVSLDLNLRQ